MGEQRRRWDKGDWGFGAEKGQGRVKKNYFFLQTKPKNFTSESWCAVLCMPWQWIFSSVNLLSKFFDFPSTTPLGCASAFVLEYYSFLLFCYHFALFCSSNLSHNLSYKHKIPRTTLVLIYAQLNYATKGRKMAWNQFRVIIISLASSLRLI